MKWAGVVKATERQTKVIVLENNQTIPDIPSLFIVKLPYN
jgi:hypothetical protein